jgi:hypothetical protein
MVMKCHCVRLQSLRLFPSLYEPEVVSQASYYNYNIIFILNTATSLTLETEVSLLGRIYLCILMHAQR